MRSSRPAARSIAIAKADCDRLALSAEPAADGDGHPYGFAFAYAHGNAIAGTHAVSEPDLHGDAYERADHRANRTADDRAADRDTACYVAPDPERTRLN